MCVGLQYAQIAVLSVNCEQIVTAKCTPSHILLHPAGSGFWFPATRIDIATLPIAPQVAQAHGPLCLIPEGSLLFPTKAQQSIGAQGLLCAVPVVVS